MPSPEYAAHSSAPGSCPSSGHSKWPVTIRVLAVANQPTPYNIDLYNAFADSLGLDVHVHYAEQRSYHHDAGHDYREFPVCRFACRANRGKTWADTVAGCAAILCSIVLRRPHAVLVAGYTGATHLVAIIASIALRVPLALSTDRFNNGVPLSGGAMGIRLRAAIRRLVFGRAFAVMVCGMIGVESAIKAGCPAAKIANFPYVIDPVRFSDCAVGADDLHEGVKLARGKPIVLFSGRLIHRKGLQVLLQALARLLESGVDCHLIVEGNGPQAQHYRALASHLAVDAHCSFVGFRQMSQHSYLVSVSEIVVVPSLDDPWGIVVHEGMMMGKVVCASDAVGSAVDRINHGLNGYLFRSGDDLHLATILTSVINDANQRRLVGSEARLTALQWSPERNVATFCSAFRERVEVGHF
ncbi:MAG: glycosyltransferase [Chloroflexota bacterium]